MSITLAADPSPIQRDAHGVLRIGGTRVTLDTVVYCYLEGASPEEIALRYEALVLPDIHATIAYYLRHRGEVDAYLKTRQEQAITTREMVEARQGIQHVRERLMQRMKQGKP